MKETPIIFSGPMVRAILDGRKEQTRRVIKYGEAAAPHGDFWRPYSSDSRWFWETNFDKGPNSIHPRQGMLCPYGVPGDRLWVREAFGYYADGSFFYKADGTEPNTKHHPSIHMPRKASRINLEITSVRVERLKDISEADAIAEGAPQEITQYGLTIKYASHREAFMELWDKLNYKRGFGWEMNPYVWRIEFSGST